MRDNFSKSSKDLVAKRAGYKCSNPDCACPTAGPIGHDDATSIGRAAHITAAACGGPRYDPSLSPAQRSSLSNAIWLCAACAGIVDSNDSLFPVDLLAHWKQQREGDALRELRLASDKIHAASLPDLLTPWESPTSVFGYMTRIWGTEAATALMRLSETAILALTDGTFEEQIAVGEKIAGLGDELASHAVASDGYYLQGEGFRFLGDTSAAETMYLQSAYRNPRSIRAFRALGIHFEAREDALSGIHYDRALSILQSTSRTASPRYWRHEKLRLARHYGSWLLQNVQNGLAYGPLEPFSLLRMAVTETEQYDNVQLALSPFWLLDWYKSEVFIGSMLSRVRGNEVDAVRHFAKAVEIRAALLRFRGELNEGDIEGLKWLDQRVEMARHTLSSRVRSDLPRSLLTRAAAVLFAAVDVSGRERIMRTWPFLSEELKLR